jgi:hypothetical protein
MLKDVLGGATENQLAQAGMSVAPHDQEVRIVVR